MDTKILKFKEGDEKFPEGKEREQLEHNYGFNREMIEDYSAALEDRIDIKAKEDSYIG